MLFRSALCSLVLTLMLSCRFAFGLATSVRSNVIHLEDHRVLVAVGKSVAIYHTGHAEVSRMHKCVLPGRSASLGELAGLGLRP